MKNDVRNWCESVRAIFEQVADLVRRSDAGHLAKHVYEVQDADIPSSAELQAVRQLLADPQVESETTRAVSYVRRAYLRRSGGAGPIRGLYHSKHEWALARARQLLAEIARESVSSERHDDVWAETCAATVDGLLREEDDAAEIFVREENEQQVSSIANAAEQLQQQAAQLKQVNSELPEVDLRLCQVRYDGVCYGVTVEGARMVNMCVRNFPRKFAAIKNDFSKPSATKASLPKQIRDILDTKGGYGLKVELFAAALAAGNQGPAPGAKGPLDGA